MKMLIGFVAMLGATIGLFAQDSLNVRQTGFFDSPGQPWGVAVAGSYAYVADGGSGLRIINISNPEAPVEIGFYDTPGVARGVAVAGQYAYVADENSDLRIINVSNPAAPFETGFCNTPGYELGVAVAGQYAYVADAYNGLRIIDISNPAAAFETGFYDTPDAAIGVAVAGQYAYVADRGTGLRIINISNPAAPFETGYYNTGNAYAVAVAGQYAYVADAGSGLRIINISNPAAPFETGFYNTGNAQGVAVKGPYAYVADVGIGSGLRIIDISNPAAPFETGFYDTPGYAQGVAVAGQYAYVADYHSGLRILDCSVAMGLVLQTPNGGENWRVFQYDTVLWTSTDAVTGLMRIELNRHYPNGLWETLTSNTPNDGQEAVYVTDLLSDSCRVRVGTMDNSFSDISDANFRITSSQGYLALAQISQPGTPVLSWNVGALECPETATIVFHLKNFGSENLLAFMPQLAVGSVFTLQTECPPSFVLSPNQMSACSLRLTYNPQAEGTHRDTLVIQTDAVNAVGGYVRIPLVGIQTRTPATPQVAITTPGSDARLSWFPISESVGGCPISVTHYLVFYSPTFAGPYYYHSYTADTTYVHLGVVRYASGQFYNVTATTAPIPLLARIARDTPREEVEAMLREAE